MSKGNVIIGQSGGPTAVINSSLAGAFKTAYDRGANKIYGMQNGIKGLLEKRYVDLSEYIKSDLDIELLKRTPSSYLGSCRFKLPKFEDDSKIYEDIFAILKELEIKHFFYIGGNDSMDTISKLHNYSRLNNIDINFMGIPKTIDNDLALTDHSPGFGSAAKFVGTTFKEIIRDGLVYGTESITIVEVMGRNAGWLTAAASLATSEDCEGPDMILLPEIPFHLEVFYKHLEELRKVKKSIIVAVSEGLKMENGTYVCELTDTQKITDAFGHKALGGTAFVLADLVARKFNCKARPIELSLMQRCASHIVSRVDLTEAFQVGGQAVKASFEGHSGEVIILVRTSSDPYGVTTDIVDVTKIANIEKKVPLEWITNEGTYVSKELTNYIRPLIQADIAPFMISGLPGHLLLKKKYR